ncbi:MAG: aspartyl protease family protein [Candidatus Eremiobacteraeota bacterium]|nr:aspartyl protease family protein [Candidatus Eremiobacteraeota bacterium]
MEKIKVWNFSDPQKFVETEGLVDTGATMLVLPQDMVDKLNLRTVRKTTVKYANNKTEPRTIYGVVTLEVKGRSANFDALAEAAGTQPLIGQIPLEALDLIVNPKSGELMPNPLSPDIPMMEII